MEFKQLFNKTITRFILILLFTSCTKNKIVKLEVPYQEISLEDKIEGKWYLMSYNLYRIKGKEELLLDSPRIELKEPVENSYINFSSYQDIEFKTPRGRSLYRSWRIKDSTIYSGCSNDIPRDCNFGNTHALLRGAFKIKYLDEKEMELICTSNFETNSKTIEKIRLIKKN